MEIDKIYPFRSTLGWNKHRVKGKFQTRKGLQWISRYLEITKGIVIDEISSGIWKNCMETEISE